MRCSPDVMKQYDNMIVIYQSQLTIILMIRIKASICHRTRDNDCADDDTITKHIPVTTNMIVILLLKKQ